VIEDDNYWGVNNLREQDGSTGKWVPKPTSQPVLVTITEEL